MTMLKYCAWCRALLDVIEDQDYAGMETHGICQTCYDLMMGNPPAPEKPRRPQAVAPDAPAFTARCR